MEKVIAYHFTGDTLRDGSPIPKKGTWLKFEKPIVICQSGLHASKEPFDALQYAPGNLLHLVECTGIVTEHPDKFVCSDRKILKSFDATDLLWEMARWSALQVIHLWNAPKVVQEYLQTGDEPLRDAARAAARDAARAAARAAAWDAAGAAELYSQMLICDGLPLAQKHIDHIAARWNVWQKGYCLLCDVGGVLYVYTKKGKRNA
jgi:hypothetical protein